MNEFRAICPVSPACPFRGPINATAIGDLVHSHIVRDHPDVIASAEEQATTGQAYRRDSWMIYEALPHA